jgi:hypothetical protein
LAPLKTPKSSTLASPKRSAVRRPHFLGVAAGCPSKLTAQLKTEKIVVLPATRDGYRAAVSALYSLDRKSGVSFHTYSLPEDRSVWLLPEGFVLEELGSRGISIQGVMQHRSGRRVLDPEKDHSPYLQFIVSVERGSRVSRVRTLTKLHGLRVSV